MVRRVAIVAFSTVLVSVVGLAINTAHGANVQVALNVASAVRDAQPGDRLIVSSETARLQLGYATLASLTKDMTVTVIEMAGDWAGVSVVIDGTTQTGWVLIDDLDLVPDSSATAPSSSRPKTPIGGSSKPKDIAKAEATKSVVSDPSVRQSTGSERTEKPRVRPADELTRDPTDSKPLPGVGQPAQPAVEQTPQPQPRQDSQAPSGVASSGQQSAKPRSLDKPADKKLPDVQVLRARSVEQIEQADPTALIGQLTLVGDQFTDRSLKKLNRLSVQKLSIETTSVTNSGLKYFKQIRDLRFLRLWSPRFSDGAVPHLAAMKDLESLDLEGSSIIGDHLDQLATLPKLRALVLGPLTKEATLSKLVELHSLEQLDLRACRRLTEASYEQLAQLKNLKQLWLPTQIARKGRTYLRGQLPDCQIL